MGENKRKHLEFIQNVITRMNSNSFLIKGWTVTLTSALCALAVKEKDLNYAFISVIVISTFWILDGFFISKEKQYRDLYGSVSMKDENLIDFSMDTSSYENEDNKWFWGVFSMSLIPFYGIFIAATLLGISFIK